MKRDQHAIGSQTYSITLEVSDDEATVSQSLDITVNDADAPPPLLTDDFSDGNFSGWAVVDEGVNSAPSSWSAASGELVQSSNINGGSAGPLHQPGTFAVFDAGHGWTNYRTSLQLRSDDDDYIGLMFRYQNADHYYRFSWSKQQSFRRLVKNVGGVFTVLAEDSIPNAQGQYFELEVSVTGNLIQVYVDDSLIFSVTDHDLASGSIALYSGANTGSRFDNIVVDP